MMVFQGLKLCQQILNPQAKVMQSVHSVYKPCVGHIIKLKPYGDG